MAAFPLVRCPKPRPRLLEQRAAKADMGKVDRAQRDICKARSKGQCEVWEQYTGRVCKFWWMRCPGRATENHHLIGGSGRRNRGRSILAAHRLSVCTACHKDITGNVLQPVDGTKKEDAVTVQYERVRFGHQRYAGYVSTEAFGQAVLFRVDVPPLAERERVTKHYGYDDDGKSVPPGSTVKEAAVQGYTKYFGPGAIYAMTPCSQNAAEQAVESMQPRKVSVVSLPPNAAVAALPPRHRDSDDDNNED